jgi:hypothetical protein
MKVVSRLAALCAVMVVASSGAWAQVSGAKFTYNGVKSGQAWVTSNEYGAVFDTSLSYYGLSGGVFDAFTARYSVCNELGRNVGNNNPYTPLSIVPLLNPAAAVGDTNQNNWYTYGRDGATKYFFSSISDQNKGAIAWLMLNDTYGLKAAAGDDRKSTNLQYAVWALWGFNGDNLDTFSPNFEKAYWTWGDTSAGSVYSLITLARANAGNVPTEAINDVVWVRLAVGDNQNQSIYQDQIMVKNGSIVTSSITPEASSLLLLLPGLLPLGLLARKRSKA